MSTKALRKELLAAIAMVIVAAIALSGSTYAWFAVNNTVTAKGMEVQAKSEGGLLISSTHQDGSWSNSASVLLDKAVQMLPASTLDTAKWYHAHSNSASNFESSGYFELTDSGEDADFTDATLAGAGKIVAANENLYDDGDATIYYDENGTDAVYTAGTDDGFYLLTKYYLCSSGDQITIGATGGNYKALAINKVSLKTINTSAQLDKCLRVGIVIYDETNQKASDFVVLAPVNGADGVTASSGTKAVTTQATSDAIAFVGLTGNGTTEYFANANTGFGKTANDIIPAKNDGKYLTAYVYVWFEGEDQTCISDNITTTLDTLAIDVSFKMTDVTGQYNDVATSTEPTA